MGKVLQTHFYKIFVLSLILCSVYTFGYGQVTVTATESFGISFSQDESRSSRNAVRFSVNDLQRQSASELQVGEIQRYPAGRNSSDGYFFVQDAGQTAIGAYYQNSESGILFNLPLRNATSEYIRSLSVAFDFLYQPVQHSPDNVFQLSYRVNNGTWKQPAGGKFTADYLQSESSDWSTFTMQIMLDELFLLPDDQLELQWTVTSEEEGTDFIPVAIQNVELFPEKARTFSTLPGELIISELMPAVREANGPVEYIELYNSTDRPMNLKGLVLYAGQDRVVVHQNLQVKPYGVVVLASAGSNRSLAQVADYLYDGSLLGKSSGEVTLSLFGNEVARGMYDISEQGTAVRLDHLENAYDGYSGLSHFVQESAEFSDGLKGTPGSIEPNSRIYSKTISRPGWHMIHPPGMLSPSLNRDLRNRLLAWNPSGSQEHEELQPGNLFLLHMSGENESAERITSTGVTRLADQGSRTIPGLDGFGTLPAPVTQTVPVGNLLNEEDRQAFPVLLTWNSDKQDFELLWQEQDQIKPWGAYIVPDSGREEVRVEVSEQEMEKRPWSGLNRRIELQLSDGERSDKQTLYDQALVGFWNSGTEPGDQEYSLPKIWAPGSEENREDRSPMIYLKSGDEEARAHSYLNATHTPENLLQIPVEVFMAEKSGRLRITWGALESLPDQWELEFVDTELDDRVDMRSEQGYTFTSRSEEKQEGVTEADLSFTPVVPKETTRFYVRISPTGDLGLFEEELESPESVELKQNYPNPFNPTTTIGFYLPKSADVRIGVFNVVGQQVGQLVDERLNAGDHTVTWNASDMPSGVYIVQMEASGSVSTRKITLIK